MIYCFDKNTPFDYTETEMALAKRYDTLILYDSSTKEFYDTDGNLFDVSGKLIFPRTGSVQVYEMNEEIVKRGGKPILSNEEIEMVSSWPNHVTLKRNVEICKGSDLTNPSFLSYLEEKYGNEIFFKTKKKDFSDVIDLSLLKNKDTAFYRAIDVHRNDEFIISDAVEVLSDDLGIEEYRVFVKDGRVANISRMTTEVFHRIPRDVLLYVESLVKCLEVIFPSYYCVDIFRVLHKGDEILDVSEFNPIHASGPYLYNSVVLASNDLEHKDIKNIAREFLGSIDECRYEGPVINNRDNTYKIPNSFSSDLRSFAIQGSLGLRFTTLPMSKKMYGNTKPLFSLTEPIESDEALALESNFKQIESDDDLLGGRSQEETDAMIEAMNKLLSIHKKG